jgi:two-component system, NarL family, response regulator LiaR
VAESISVLLVDDHAVVREGLRSLLEVQDGIEVVAEAVDGEAAVREAEARRPDVVLMDLVMPRLDGVGAMRELRRRLPSARVIVLTSFADDDRLLPAIQAGAAHRGDALLDPSVAARLVDAIAQPPGTEPSKRLTPREQEVLALIARGMPNKLIARELGISEKTVKTHVGHVLAKLGVTDRTQAALQAVREGLVDPRP